MTQTRQLTKSDKTYIEVRYSPDREIETVLQCTALEDMEHLIIGMLRAILTTQSDFATENLIAAVNSAIYYHQVDMVHNSIPKALLQ